MKPSWVVDVAVVELAALVGAPEYRYTLPLAEVSVLPLTPITCPPVAMPTGK